MHQMSEIPAPPATRVASLATLKTLDSTVNFDISSELPEICPRKGRIVQWKGKKIVAADSTRKKLVEPILAEIRLIATRSVD